MDVHAACSGGSAAAKTKVMPEVEKSDASADDGAGAENDGAEAGDAEVTGVSRANVLSVKILISQRGVFFGDVG